MLCNLPYDSKDFDSNKNIIYCINSQGPDEPYPKVHIDKDIRFYNVMCHATEVPSRSKKSPLQKPRADKQGKYHCSGGYFIFQIQSNN